MDSLKPPLTKADPAYRGNNSPTTLTAIKLIHTLVWALLAGCVLAIPVAAWCNAHRAAACLTVVVAAEIVLLWRNGGRCPLTTMAARFTDNRSENFDIYLPLWLARHNKLIFGLLYLAGVTFALARLSLAVSWDFIASP